MNKKYKSGSAGQLKGKDAIKKTSKPGGNETPHPARGKLVGEDQSAWDKMKHGWQNYNKLSAVNPGDNVVTKKDKTDSKDKKKSNHTKVSNGRLNPKKEVPPGAIFNDGKRNWVYKNNVWQAGDGSTMATQAGIDAYNKASKDKRQFVLSFKEQLYRTLKGL